MLVLPDILANAGGVVVSYFEWVQGLQEYFWKEDEVNARLNEIVTARVRRDLVDLHESRDPRCAWPPTAWPSSGSPRRRSSAGSTRRAPRRPGSRSTTPRAATSASGPARSSRRCATSSASRWTEVDITGDPELEARYREWLPVVEVDGARVSVYHLDEAALRRGSPGRARRSDGGEPAAVERRAASQARAGL